MRLYFGWADALFNGLLPYRDFSFEYPPAALLLFALPRLLAPDHDAYVGAFLLMMWIADLAQKWLLYRLCRQRGALAVALHSACGVALYYTYLKRFDVAVATVLFVTWLAAWQAPHRLRAWGFWAFGVALKLVPLFFAPLLTYAAWQRGGGPRRAVRNAAIGIAILLASFAAVRAWAGPAAFSWSAYHQARGLHVGSSYAALRVLYQGLGHPLPWTYNFGAHHLLGSWTNIWTRLSSPITVAFVVLTAVVMRRGMRTEAGHWRAGAATLLAVLLSSKVFSPQFVAWLVPVVLAAALRCERIDWALLLGLAATVGFTGELFPGETALLRGGALKQAALVARTASLTILWLYLMVTPNGLSAGHPATEGIGTTRVFGKRR